MGFFICLIIFACGRAPCVPPPLVIVDFSGATTHLTVPLAARTSSPR